VVWAKRYPFGIDSMSLSPDGNTIYMPTGELASSGIWKVIDAHSGSVTASIDSGGAGPHNTVMSPDGAGSTWGRDTQITLRWQVQEPIK
jgi:hypothetical protein